MKKDITSSPSPSQNKVFVYETLKSDRLRQHLFKENVPYTPATLKGYRDINTGDNYHTLIDAPLATTNGEVLSLTPHELHILDLWETRYERKQISLADGTHAWCYFLKR